MSTIKGYGDYFWVDVVEKIDEWGQQVLQYQNQCKKLPKALRDWQAYVDCRDTIDNFLEMLPLFQALAHKAMRERHWKSIMQITGELRSGWESMRVPCSVDAHMHCVLHQRARMSCGSLSASAGCSISCMLSS